MPPSEQTALPADPPERRMTAKLVDGPVGKHLADLTVPMIWGILSISAFNIIDTFFVGQLGTRELAAISFTFPVVLVMGSLALGLGTGTASVVARAIGHGDRGRVRRLTTDALLLAVLIVAVFVAIGLATIDPLFRLLGASEDLLPLIRDYMQIWYLGMVFLVVPMVGNAVIRATGDTRFPSYIMMTAAGVNIVLDPILIFGLLGMPRMELEGAALATVIARAVTLVAALWVLIHREDLICLNVPRWSSVWRSWRGVLHVGVPAAGANVINPVTAGVVTALMAGFGEEAVAAFGVATRVEAFALIVIFALGAGIAPFIGQNMGAGRLDRIREAVRLGTLFCLVFGLIAAAVLLLAGGPVAALFDDSPAVVAIAATYLAIVPISYGAQGVVLISVASFNAVGRPGPAVLLAVGRMFALYIPLAYLGAAVVGPTGVFAAAAVANVIAGAAAFGWNHRTCRLVHADRHGTTAEAPAAAS